MTPREHLFVKHTFYSLGLITLMVLAPVRTICPSCPGSISIHTQIPTTAWLGCLPAPPWLTPCTKGRTSQFPGPWESHRGAFCSSGVFVPTKSLAEVSCWREREPPTNTSSLTGVEPAGFNPVTTPDTLLSVTALPDWLRRWQRSSALSQFNNPQFQHCGDDPISKH